MFHRLDTVRIKEALPSAGLAAGAQGAVLEVFGDGHCMVEFVAADGQTIADPILAPELLSLVTPSPAERAQQQG